MPHINFLAVFLAAVAAMAFGSVWYSLKSPTGKLWLKEVGFKIPTPDEMKTKQGEVIRSMLMYTVGVLLTEYVLFHMLATYKTATYGMALQGAFWTWLGFYAAPGLGVVAFEHRSWKLYAVNQAFFLIMLALSSLIFVSLNA